MKRYTLLLSFLVLVLAGVAQTGISAGFTTIKGFGVPKVFPGMHVGVEVPRDDQVSYYGRLVFTLPNVSDEVGTVSAEARDLATSPQVKSVNFNSTMNHISIEGGTRYYLGNGYDYGWSAYGGSLFMLTLNSVKMKFDDFDESKYQLQDGLSDRGRIIGLNLGLNAGVKNHFSFGMVYFDLTLSYSLFQIANNATAQQGGGQLYSPLIFGFNLGFRKDLY